MITIMKQSVIFSCCWGIFLGIFAFAVFAEDAPVAVKQAAEQGLPSFLQAIPARTLAILISPIKQNWNKQL
ncbi:hypothetical protein U27_01759 [Candidatus Vecturithrix granuli]|uniref:Uncharacterized protein n=1 Tax=Vecturithrix granuli TaxID=1499967 RepID=A0A0S6W5M4_VECG1|nr:hypothetical protein U27_01759 [Candidatus Vecturithrix granuli]